MTIANKVGTVTRISVPKMIDVQGEGKATDKWTTQSKLREDTED